MKSRIKAAGMFLGGVALLTAGYGFVYTGSQAVQIWQKVGQAIQTVPSNLTLDFDGNTVDMATSTVVASSDGFTAGGGIAPASVATGTAITLYTHTGGRAVCKGAVGAAYADSTGAGAPSLQFSVGTTSGSTVNEASLIATSTLATTTDRTAVASSPADYILEAGDLIVAYFADGDSSDGNTLASTTHFSDWDIEFQNWCYSIGG